MEGPRLTIDDWILVRSRSDCRSSSGVLECEIVGATTEDVEALDSLRTLDVMEGFRPVNTASRSRTAIAPGQTARFRLLPHLLPERIGWRHFETLDDLLNAYPVNPPAVSWYVHDLNYRSSSETVPEEIQQYTDVRTFGRLLTTVSDHCIAETQCYFIHGKRQYLISVSYSRDDLRSIPDVSTVYEVVAVEEVRSRLLRNALVSYISDRKAETSFADILRDAKYILDEYRVSFEIFLDQSSLENLIDEYEEKRLRYIERITGVFSDVQVKLLSIPTALILIVTQIDFGAGATGKNIGLFVGAFAFSLVLTFSFSAHRHTINLLYRDLNYLEGMIRRLLNMDIDKADHEKMPWYTRLWRRDEAQLKGKLARVRNEIRDLKRQHGTYLVKLTSVYAAVWTVPILTFILILVN